MKDSSSKIPEGDGETINNNWTSKLPNGLSEDHEDYAEEINNSSTPKPSLEVTKDETCAALRESVFRDLPDDRQGDKDLENEISTSDLPVILANESDLDDFRQHSSALKTEIETIPNVAQSSITAGEIFSEDVLSDNKLNCDKSLLTNNEYDDFHEFNTVNHESVQEDDNDFSEFTDFIDCKTSGFAEGCEASTDAQRPVDSVSGLDDFNDFESAGFEPGKAVGEVH